MGSYTTFKIRIVDCTDAIRQQIIEDIVELSGEDFDDIYYPFGTFQTYCKWYDYDDHLTTVSSKYDNILIECIGYGEYHGDIWVHYFKNGKSYKREAKVVFDVFSEDHLK
jgi:hypothetical protein